MKLKFVILLSVFTLLLTGCGFSLAEDITPPPNYVSPTPGPTDSPLYPQAAPDIRNGQAIYAEKCAPCHGDQGLGDGPMAAQLQKQPAAIGSSELGRKSAIVNWFTTVTNGNINSFMPPFKDSLDDQQRWDVVAYSASLGGFTAAEANAGQALYDANCSMCHGASGNLIPNANLSDQALMSKLSQDDIANFIVNGVGKMPGFGSTIPEDGVYAISSYVRSMTIPLPAGMSSAEQSQPEATATILPEATAAAEATVTTSSEAQPAEVATQDPLATPAEATAEVATEGTAQATVVTADTTATPAAVIGVVKGKVTNGTLSEIPANLKVTLHGFAHNSETQQFNEILTKDSAVNADGSFEFKDISFTDSQAFYASIEYSDTTFNSEPGFIEPNKEELELPLVIYETTTDQAALKADQVHLLLDYSKPNVVQVVEFLIFSNTGTKAILATEPGGPVIDVPLPSNYTNLQFEAGAIGDRYLKTEKGFADTTTITPGEQSNQIVFSVDLPLSKANLFGTRSVSIDQEIPFAATNVTILAPEGITVKGSNVQSSGLTDMGNGAKYLSYSLTLQDPNRLISIEINGEPKDSKIASNSSSTGIIIGVGALGVVLILVGVWLYFNKKQDSAEDDDEGTDDEDDPEEEELMDSIITLDDQFKSGKLDEAVYKSKRAELTEKLKTLSK